MSAAVGTPLVLAGLTGSLGIPHNDAWSHARIAQTFASTGQIRLVGWNRTALVGQIVPLGPLGDSITVQNLFASVCAVLALLMTWHFVKRRTTSGYALLTTATIAAVPEFGLLATSFMSDMPAFAGMMTCLVLADRAQDRSSIACAVSAVGVGVWSCTVREQAVLALAVAALRLLRDPALGRTPALRWSLGTALAALATFEIWRRSLPFGDPVAVSIAPLNVVYAGLGVCFTASLYALPVLARSCFASWSRAQAVAAMLLSAGSLILAAKLDWLVLLGNYFAPSGAYGGVSPVARAVFPVWAWTGVVIAASLGLGVALVRAGPLRVSTDRYCWLIVALFGAGTAAQALVGQSVFARYLLPALPALAVLVHRPIPVDRTHLRAPARTASLAPLATVGALSFMVTANALSFDGARWELATRLVASGIPAPRIDAGMEWVGFHSPGTADFALSRSSKEPFYVAMMQADPCVWIGDRQHTLAAPTAVLEYRKYAILGPFAELRAYAETPCP